MDHKVVNGKRSKSGLFEWCDRAKKNVSGENEKCLFNKYDLVRKASNISIIYPDKT